MRGKPIKDVIQNVIDRQRKQLVAERDKYAELAHDNSSFWGMGGPVRRQEKAAEDREARIKELDDFENQLRNARKHVNIKAFAFQCSKCKAAWFTVNFPFNGWHECPVCRGMMFIENPHTVEFQMVDEGPNSWSQMFKNSKEWEESEE